MGFQVVGIYSDIGASKRGAAQGVGLLIDALKKDYPALMEKEIKIINDFSIPQDSAPPIQHRYAKNIEAIYGFFKEKLIPAISKVIESQNFPIIFSGDHSSALGCLSAFKQAYGNQSIGVIWVDAHSDLHTPYDSDSGNIHGMPLGGTLNLTHSGSNALEPATQKEWERLCSLGGKNTIKPENVSYIGTRSMEKSERETIKKFHIPLYGVKEVRQNMAEVIDKVVATYEKVDGVYLSVDIDVLDGKIFTSTGVRENNGLYPSELEALIKALIEALRGKLIAVEFTEFNPALKDSNPSDTEVFASIISKALTQLIATY